MHFLRSLGSFFFEFALIELFLFLVLVLLTLLLPKDKFRKFLSAPIRFLLKVRKSSIKKEEYNYYDEYAYFIAMLFDTQITEELASAIAIRVFNSKKLICPANDFYLQLYIGFLQGNLTEKDCNTLKDWASINDAEDIFELVPIGDNE